MSSLEFDNPKVTSIASKVCFLAVISAFIALVTFVLGLLSLGIDDGKFMYSMSTVAVFSFPLSLVIAIISLIRIKRSNGRLRGEGLAKFFIAGTVFCIFILSIVYGPMHGARELAHKIVCKSHMKCLGVGLFIYAADSDDVLTSGEKWTELALKYDDEVTGEIFICPMSGNVLGQSSYGFNELVAGRKLSEMPADTVVLFEAKVDESAADRLNVSGGAELLCFDRHGVEGCNIFFADGSVEFVAVDKLSDLRWDPGL